MFLDPAAQDFYVERESLAGDTVALLRAEAGRDPFDRALSDLIGELSTRSETFRVRWAAHTVRFHRTGVKHLHHPIVGDLTLTYESMDLTADAGLRLNAYSAEPGTASEDALSLLASWTATPQERAATRSAESQRTTDKRARQPQREERQHGICDQAADDQGAGRDVHRRRLV